jgi:hypothetical protein
MIVDRDLDQHICRVLRSGPRAMDRLINLLILAASISSEPDYEVAERLRDVADSFEHPPRGLC